jgi:hypothetical protein
MRRPPDDAYDIRVPSEALARWALETEVGAQEATCAALAFLVHVEHAGTTLLPVPAVVRSEQAVLDPDGFLRQPRGALEHFRMRAARASAWMDLFIFFRERFPTAAQRQPPEALYSMAQLFGRRDDDVEAATDLMVRDCVMPEIEDVLAHTLTYPPLQAMMSRLRETERGGDARRLAGAVLGELTGARLWKVRTRLVTTGTRALLAAKPLLDELERGGFKVDRTRSARGFARRLEEAVADLPGTPILEAILRQLGGSPEEDALRQT